MTDYLQDLGYLALSSRLKRLSEKLAVSVAEVYQAEGIKFEPRWFPVFRLLADRGLTSVTEIAQAIGITHPAVNQIAAELEKAGLIKAVADSTDRRKRMLKLTNKGNDVCKQLQKVWQGLHAAVSDSVAESGADLVNAAAAMEKALNKRSLLSRYEQYHEQKDCAKIEIVDLTPEYSQHFARLNRAWIEKYFSIETSDLAQLGNPEKIIEEGGAVLFARIGEKIVGTCALKKIDEQTIELIKMAVDEAYRGLGIGRLLMEAAISRAQKMNFKQVRLETNSKLKEAVGLYKAVGFKEIALEAHLQSKYARVDLIMEMQLSSASLHIANK
jgi:ribosomal protein S18 acetylase RimI-like enzyme/DNA-binding HxlR family transcriptional regulator